MDHKLVFLSRLSRRYVENTFKYSRQTSIGKKSMSSIYRKRSHLCKNTCICLKQAIPSTNINYSKPKTDNIRCANNNIIILFSWKLYGKLWIFWRAYRPSLIQPQFQMVETIKKWKEIKQKLFMIATARVFWPSLKFFPDQWNKQFQKLVLIMDSILSTHLFMLSASNGVHDSSLTTSVPSLSSGKQ